MPDLLHKFRSSHRREHKVAYIFYVLAILFFCFTLSLRIADWRKTDAAPTMQLVRLNINSDAGMVRIEVTADGSFAATTIEQTTRGAETVIHIRGARSLLRQSYQIDDKLATHVRVLAGDRNGEPFVDLIIKTGGGAAVAQKVSFNRLVIGIASDFASLRKRNQNTTATARKETPTTSAQGFSGNLYGDVPTAPTTATAPASAKAQPSSTKPQVNLAERKSEEKARASSRTSDSTSKPATAKTSAPPISSARPASTFRGRTIWNNLETHADSKPHANLSAMALMFQQTPNSIVPPVLSISNSLPMLLEAPGETPGTWIPGTTTSVTDEIGGRVVWKGLLRPSFLLGATYDDNYFYRTSRGRAVGVLAVAPRVEYEIPGQTRAMRVAFETQLRRLTTGEWINAIKGDFDTRIDVNRVLRLSLRDHFARSSEDPREFDPAGEVYIVGDTFTRNDGAARASLSFDKRNRIALGAGYNFVKWDKNRINGAPLFLNYNDLNSSLSYERDVSETTTATAEFDFTNTTSSVPFRSRFDGLSDNRRYAFQLGARKRFAETGGLAFRIGYQRNLFTLAPRANNFSGLVFDLAFRQDLTEKSVFELAALRKTQVSIFNIEGGNARLATTGGSARLERQIKSGWKLGLALSYQRLGFPVAVAPNATASGGLFVGNFAGERRNDNLYGFSVDAAYRWSEYLRSHLAYSFMRRDSSLNVFTFNRNRFSLVFELGRRNDARGRSF